MRFGLEENLVGCKIIKKMKVEVATCLLVALLVLPLATNSETNDQYHIQTDEGPERYFRYQTHSGQYRKEKRLEDGTVIGSYGWIDQNGLLRLREYIADNEGYRIVKSKNVYVGRDRPIGQAINAAKKVPGVSETFVKPLLPKPVLPTTSFEAPKVSFLPTKPAFLPTIYQESTPAPPTIYQGVPCANCDLVPGIGYTPNVQISLNSLPSSTEKPFIKTSVTPLGLGTFAPSSTPAPDVFIHSTTPSVFAPSSSSLDSGVHISSTPAPFVVSSTPSSFLGSSTPATFLASSTPSNFLGSSTPSTFVGSSTPSTFLASTPTTYGAYSTPSSFLASTPSTILVTPTPPPATYHSPAKISPISSINSNALDFYSSEPQYEHYETRVNPYIFRNGPTYPIDKHGNVFTGDYQNSNSLSGGQRYDSRFGQSGQSGQYQNYDGVSVTNDGFRYYIPRAYHEEKNFGVGQKAGSFGYIDPFGIRRVVYYNAAPGTGFLHRKNNRYVGFNAPPYDPRPFNKK